MKRTILLIGKNGQIGSELCDLLPQMGEVVSVDRLGLDLSRPEQIRDTVRATRPDVIVNAAAYTAVDQAESDEAGARAINAIAPGILGEEAQRLKALLVHYSTDYVFDGTKRVPYVEGDEPRPQSVYGETKLLGERAIQQSGAPHLIFRTSWVYAPRGRNFLLTILRLATQRDELKIVRDQVGAPTLAREVALACCKVLSQICGDGRDAEIDRAKIGIYHMTAAGETNWHAFADSILKEVAGCAVPPAWLIAATQHKPLITRRIVPISTAEYPTAARRPAYSVLSNARLAEVFGVQLPDWLTQLRSCFSA